MADIRDLKRRIEQLEAMVGAGGGADFIGFSDEFDGEIIASGGIAIPASDTANPPNTRRIRWFRSSDGAVLAQDYAFDNAVALSADRGIVANPAGVTSDAVAWLEAKTQTGLRTYFQARAVNGGNSLLQAVTGGRAKTVLDFNGASDYAYGDFSNVTAPKCSVITTGATALGAGWTVVPFPAESYDSTGAMHNNAVLNTRIVAPAPGKYNLQATCLMNRIAVAAAGHLVIRRNGTDYLAGQSTTRGDSASVYINVTALGIEFAANQYAELYALDSNGAGGTLAAHTEVGGSPCRLTMELIGP